MMRCCQRLFPSLKMLHFAVSLAPAWLGRKPLVSSGRRKCSRHSNRSVAVVTPAFYLKVSCPPPPNSSWLQEKSLRCTCWTVTCNLVRVSISPEQGCFCRAVLVFGEHRGGPVAGKLALQNLCPQGCLWLCRLWERLTTRCDHRQRPRWQDEIGTDLDQWAALHAPTGAEMCGARAPA